MLSSKYRDSALFLLIALTSFVIFLSQNPSSVLPRTTMYFDAAHYLETTSRLFDTCGTFVAGKLTAGALDSLAFFLFLDGPVLPGAAAFLFYIMHKAPALAEWQSLVLMQCFFQALCSGFVFLLARVFFKPLPAVIAAAMWATYPSAISSCNSFLTEPMACLLSVSFIYTLTGLSWQNEEKATLADYLKSAAAGLSFALLALLKPALAPAAVAAGAAVIGGIFYKTVLEHRRTGNWKSSTMPRFWLRPVLAIVGAAIVFIPWFSFGIAARGAITILPSRRPVYNIATGCNVEGDGWGCYPTHPVALMYDDNEQALPVALALVEANPTEMANLALRKITRLWNLPWNDYRYKILGLNYHIQSLYHLLLVVLGVNGLCLLFAGLFRAEFSFRQKLAAASIMLFLAGHLIYLPFEGIGRYGFTTMPFLVIACVFMVRQLYVCRKHWRQVGAFALAIALVVLMAKVDLLPFISILLKDTELAVLIQALLRTGSVMLCTLSLCLIDSAEPPAISAGSGVYANKPLLGSGIVFTIMAAAISLAFAYSDRESQSWLTNLRDNDVAERSVNVSLNPEQKPDWALILIDGDHNLEKANASINGEPVRGSFESFYQFNTEKYELEDWMNQFASLTRRSPSANRKWRAIEVPVASVKNGWNSISISAPADGQAVTIYGDYQRKHNSETLMLASPEQVSPGKFFNDSEDAFDSRIIQRTYSKIAESRCSFFHAGKKREDDLSNKAGTQTGSYRIYLLLGYAHKQQGAASEQNPQIFKRSLSAGPSPDTPIKLNAGVRNPQMSVPIPEQCKTGTHVRVHISGKARGQNESSFSVAGISNESKRFISTVLPGAPKLFATQTPTWTAFDFQSDLPTITCSEAGASLKVELAPVSENTQIYKLQVELQPINKPQMSGHSIKIF